MTLREAFCIVLEAEESSRLAVLGSLPEALRAEVASLVEAHVRAGRFLNPADPLGPGSRLGPYRMEGIIGEGGMGLVYRAVRDDGEFQREVAIKVVGGRFFAPEAERRFIEERRILARLDHPNIVRMIDGGIAGGQRYLVMELIDGSPITDYCARHSLSLRERVRLFQTVCLAASYSHQHLVLHRDIKPKNVLVSTAGQVKILDFGIARMLDEETATRTGTLAAMSITHASPEQLRGERPTPASDIYALGLLIYEILAGQPLRLEMGMGKLLASLDQPVEPPGKMNRGIPADLDAIVLKALAPEPRNRYTSAGEMASDLQRFLDGRPVEARPPTRWYYAARFWARNKAFGTILAVLCLAVAAGFVAAVVEGQRATEQAAIAQRRFDVSRRMIRTVIHDLQPRLSEINGTVEVRSLLVAGTLQYLEALSKDAADSPGLMRDLIDGYVQLAAVTGAGGEASLGNTGKSGEILARAGVLAESLLRADGKSPDSLRAVNALFRARAYREAQFGSSEKAQAYARQSLALAERLSALLPDDERSRDTVALATAALADVATSALERIELYGRAVEIWNAQEQRHPDPQRRRNLALMHRDRSSAFMNGRKFPQALEAARMAEQIDRELLAAHPQSPAARLDLAFDLGAMADAQRAQSDFARAEQSYRESTELREKVTQADPKDFRAADRFAHSLFRLAGTEEQLKKWNAARRDYERSATVYSGLADRGSLTSYSRLTLVMDYSSLARLDRLKGAAAGACAHLRSMKAALAQLDSHAAFSPIQREDLARMQNETSAFSKDGCAAGGR
ncbi:MAG: serine/threonine-protein kinase [Acidobacteriota bacterium]